MFRERPPSHDLAFLRAHGPEAASRPETCAGCHVRSDCTECHRPGAGVGRGFHPVDFLSRHPAAAYARETSCSDCHATGEFYVGHGAAARINLETCTSCHVERDCLACHSSTGGRGVDPHGPDFDAEALRRANPQMCAACHGSEIPTAP